MTLSEAGAILAFPLAFAIQIWVSAHGSLVSSWLSGTCLEETTHPFIPCYPASSYHKEVFPKQMEGISHRMSNYCVMFCH